MGSKSRQCLCLVLLGIVLVLPGYAQLSAPKYSNEFLSIGVGARAFAMGGAQVAVTNDVTAGYWNPAGLQLMETKYDVSLMHAEYFAGIAKYDYGAFATRLDSVSTIGGSIIRFAVDDIPDTRFLFDAAGNSGRINYNNITYFSAADYAFLFTYARKVPKVENLHLGANVKIIHRIVGDFATAWGFGLDAGLRYKYKKWQLGLVARDLTSTFNAWAFNKALLQDVFIATGNEVPNNSIELTLPRLVPGVSRSFLVKKKVGVMLSGDMVITFDGKRNTAVRTGVFSIDPAFGIELDYKKVVFLRGGVNNMQRLQDFDLSYYTTVQPSFGIGVRIYKFFVDYALTDLGNVSDTPYSNVFSLRFAFDEIK